MIHIEEQARVNLVVYLSLLIQSSPGICMLQGTGVIQRLFEGMFDFSFALFL